MHFYISIARPMKPVWKPLAALVAAACTLSAQADFIGLNIGAKVWTPDISGSVNGGGGDISLQNNLGYTDQTSNSLNLSFEHPIPMLPNIKIQNSDLNATSSSTLQEQIEFDNQTYIASTAVNSTLDLSHNDLVLYYELLDNWVNLDVGVDLKKFDGRVSIQDQDKVSSITVDETIPMLYIAARFDLPLSGFYVGANFNQIGVGDSSAEDNSVMLGYESSQGMGIEGGIKTFTIDLQDTKDLNTNLEYDGLYVNGFYHF